MNKVFKPYTIVPDELYIERSADVQIQEILKDGGRPGYILVARQMGKTNLLLHTKEKMQSSSCVVAYIDLSNKFDTDRECFRNIIDMTIETNESVLSDLLVEIYERRNKTSALPAHKEHERELRFILGSVERLIIILDEVDALTNTSYSDRIFAQIRSIYFSRKNFPEYNRLTYVLSGVAEPAEIIKDKSISPFNIGEKIFLSDFSRDEMFRLLEHSLSDIGNDLKGRVYYWTNGNPRMSWEIASRLEELFTSKANVDVADVDDLVEKTYIQRLDLPPVDHIRDLVVSSKSLRNSLVSLHFDKGDALTASEISKLYLAGIIDSDFSNPCIKNRILERALTLEWIESVEKTKMNLYDKGLLLYKEGSYYEAMMTFEKYLEEDIEDSEKSTVHLQLAPCYYHVGEFSQALDSYRSSLLPKEGYKDLYYDNIFNQGNCYLALNETEKALEKFEEVASQEGISLNKLNGMLNTAGCYYFLDYKKYKNKIQSINNNILSIINNDVGVELRKNKRLNSLEVNALFNLGRIAYLNEDYSLSGNYFDNALSKADMDTKPAILYNKLLSSSDSDIQILLEEIIEYIVGNRVQLNRKVVEEPLLFNEELLYDLMTLAIVIQSASYEKLLTYTTETLFKSQVSKSKIIRVLIDRSEKDEQYDDATKLMEFFIKKYFKDLKVKEYHYFLQMLLNFGSSKSRNDYFKDYLSLLRSKKDDLSFDDMDFKILFERISSEINNKNFKKAKESISIAREVFKDTSTYLQGNSYLIDMLEVNLLSASQQDEQLLLRANDILSRINTFKVPDKSYILTEDLMSTFKANLSNIIKNTAKLSPRINRKIGRNEYVEVSYIDGRGLKRTKYKKVIVDLENGLCKILRVTE